MDFIPEADVELKRQMPEAGKALGAEIQLETINANDLQPRITAAIQSARQHGAAVVAQRVTDTLKQSADGQTIQCTVDRSRLWSVQTPQVFHRAILIRAIEEARRRGVDGVICGHIHKAESRMIGDVLYINDGDWVESCTALVEHADGRLEILEWAKPQRTAPLPRPGLATPRPIAA